MRVQDDDIDEEGYSISLDLVVAAWRRYRPVNSQQDQNGAPSQSSPSKRASEKPRTQTKGIKDIFGTMFTSELMANINLVLYNFVESEKQIRQKMDYKTEFKNFYRGKKELIMKKNDKIDWLQEQRAEEAP